MKSTGIVRRIDELGRIVIPKEIRRILRIREGDSIEICTDFDTVILKKYSLVESMDNFITQYVAALHDSSKKEIIVVDNEKVLAISDGLKQNYVGKKIDIKLDYRMQLKETTILENGTELEICEGFSITAACVLKPIMVYSDVIGAVIVLGDNVVTETEKMLAELTSIFIGKYLEN